MDCLLSFYYYHHHHIISHHTTTSYHTTPQHHAIMDPIPLCCCTPPFPPHHIILPCFIHTCIHVVVFPFILLPYSLLLVYVHSPLHPCFPYINFCVSFVPFPSLFPPYIINYHIPYPWSYSNLDNGFINQTQFE